MIERLRIGHLAFGVAFAAIGASWLLGEPSEWEDVAWLVVVAGLALGVAGLVTVLVRLVR